jgi:hypothetical protein
MQKLVMMIHFSDECTYSFTETHPIMYESVEKALCDFEAINYSSTKEFKFCGHNFYGNMNKDKVPDFYTLEEWFEMFAEKKRR